MYKILHNVITVHYTKIYIENIFVQYKKHCCDIILCNVLMFLFCSLKIRLINSNEIYILPIPTILTSYVKFCATLSSTFASWMLTTCTRWFLWSNPFTKLIAQIWWLVDATGCTTKIDNEVVDAITNPDRIHRNKYLDIVT